MSWLLVGFARCGPARYMSHLDTARVVQRTFARAGIALALSQGMRPKPRLSLPLPLPTGAAGDDELAVVGVSDAGGGLDATDSERLRALREAAPGGIVWRWLVGSGERPRPQAVAATYDCRLPARPERVDEALEWFAAEPAVTVVRDAPKGRRVVEVKKYVTELATSPWGDDTRLAFTLRYGPAGAARVDEVVAALAGRLGIEPVVLDLTRRCVEWQGLPPGLLAPGAAGLPGRADPGPEEGLPVG